MKQYKSLSRRKFIKASGVSAAAFALNTGFLTDAHPSNKKIPVYAHLWVYASKYPPDWNCTPVLDTVFSDLSDAGLQGVEVMEILLREDNAVNRFKELIHQYNLPVTGTSYYGDMWDKDQQQKILEDVELVTGRLHEIGGTMIGLTVGDAHHKKTEAELDAQAELLKKILVVCNKKQINPNLHNHTFEVADNLHDLKGTLARIPGIKLGPDLNWLVRAGVDAVWFIKTYADKIVYMHIRDQYANGRWTEYVGEGVTDFPAIAKALNDVHYNGKAAIELAFDDPPKNPLRQDWKMSLDYVRTTFNWQ